VVLNWIIAYAMLFRVDQVTTWISQNVQTANCLRETKILWNRWYNKFKYDEIMFTKYIREVKYVYDEPRWVKAEFKCMIWNETIYNNVYKT
jgi:hypothetical protein